MDQVSLCMFLPWCGLRLLPPEHCMLTHWVPERDCVADDDVTYFVRVGTLRFRKKCRLNGGSRIFSSNQTATSCWPALNAPRSRCCVCCADTDLHSALSSQSRPHSIRSRLTFAVVLPVVWNCSATTVVVIVSVAFCILGRAFRSDTRSRVIAPKTVRTRHLLVGKVASSGVLSR